MLEQRKEDGHQQHPAGGLPPLHGIRVIDWTHVLAGPYSSHILCRLGAEVIRIERHDEPDIIRGTASDPLLAARELGEGFVIQGTGKKSIAVDARDPRMRAALDKLIGTADVLVENFRPGKLSRLGFAPQSLIERHPNLVVCSITGFGQTGARSGRRAYDHIIQAATGLMVANADQSGQPQRIGLPIIDYVTGMQAAIAILAALQRRAHELARGRPRTRGEWLDVSMLESALTVSAQSYATYAVSGIERQASRATAFSGNPLSGT
ncbi:MAG: CoA transferase, partial [Burkholderiaceae bacterium]